MERKTVNLLDGGRYEGEVNDAGLPHGRGSATWPDGERHEGAWRKGVMHGEDVMFLPDGGRYRGDFADGLPHSQGSMAHPDGTHLSGQWWYGGLYRSDALLPNRLRTRGGTRGSSATASRTGGAKSLKRTGGATKAPSIAGC